MESQNQTKDLSINTFTNEGQKTYCSFKPATHADKVKLYNAMTSCDVRINDIVDTEIEIKDIYIREYVKQDKETGEDRTGHTSIIFGTDGKTYVTASNYFFSSLRNLLNSFGTPDTWETPMKIKIVKQANAKGLKFLTFKLV